MSDKYAGVGRGMTTALAMNGAKVSRSGPVTGVCLTALVRSSSAVVASNRLRSLPMKSMPRLTSVEARSLLFRPM